MGKLLRIDSGVKFPRVYGRRRDDDKGVLVTFTFTQSVEFDGAELVGLSSRELVDRARGLVASQYDGDLVDGAHLLLSDADVDVENILTIQLGGE